MRVCPEDHRHIHLPATRNQLAQHIAVFEPVAAVMQRNGCGIKGDDAAGAEKGALRMDLLKEVKPEGGIIVPGSLSTKASCAQRMAVLKRVWSSGRKIGGTANPPSCANADDPPAARALPTAAELMIKFLRSMMLFNLVGGRLKIEIRN